jgi:hypothetical protein
MTNNIYLKSVWWTIIMVVFFGITAFADTQNTFTFQGRLENNNGSPISSTLNMTFKIYDNHNNNLWSESLPVTVIAGEFNLMLGKSSSNPIALSVNEQARYIGLAVGGDPEMEPRQEIGGVLRAGVALSVTDAAITTSKLADSSVTSGKLSSSAVIPEKLAGPAGALTAGTSGQSLISNGNGTFSWGTVSAEEETNITTSTTNITLSANDNGIILVSGNSTVTLPSPSSAQGKQFTIKKTDSTNTVTISGTLDGFVNPELTEQYSYVSVISNGTTWYVIGQHPEIGCQSGSMTYNYTGSVQELTVPTCCTSITIESWGAQGGVGYSSTPGGLGGYAYGTYTVGSNKTFYIYVGQMPSDTYYGGWNGGGSSSQHGDYGGGGGASDVRTISGTWNNSSSLSSRIIVAAGGAGGNYSNPGDPQGGGLTSFGNYPASQSAAGTGGGFGYGGDAAITTAGYPNSGGGGGWYGGGANPSGNSYAGGSGGSSYIGSLQSSGTDSGVNSGHGKVIISW